MLVTTATTVMNTFSNLGVRVQGLGLHGAGVGPAMSYFRPSITFSTLRPDPQNIKPATLRLQASSSKAQYQQLCMASGT